MSFFGLPGKGSVQGRVRVRIIEAKDLPNKDGLFGKSDPYCKVLCAGKYHKTKTINNNPNPYWNETFELNVYNPNQDSITLEVYDFDYMSANDLIGSANLPVSNLSQGVAQDLWLGLIMKRKGAGSIHVEVTAIDFQGGNAKPSYNNQPMFYSAQNVNPYQAFPPQYFSQQQVPIPGQTNIPTPTYNTAPSPYATPYGNPQGSFYGQPPIQPQPSAYGNQPPQGSFYGQPPIQPQPSAYGNQPPQGSFYGQPPQGQPLQSQPSVYGNQPPQGSFYGQPQQGQPPMQPQPSVYGNQPPQGSFYGQPQQGYPPQGSF